MADTFDVNWIGVILAAIANMIIGSLWYSPYLFGKEWAEAQKMDIRTLVATPLHYAGAFLISLLTAFVLAVLLHKFGIVSYENAFTLAFWIWLGFVATTHFSGVLWAKRPLKSYLIDTAYALLSFLVMAAVLVTL